MKYKYYIYKQADLTDTFDKYDLNDYTLFREVTVTNKWNLKPGRDKEFYTVIRWEFEGEIAVKGADFTALMSLEHSYIQYAIVIERECEGIYSIFWKGFFSYFNYVVDLDNCNLSFEPKVWDAYSPVFDQLPVDRNILAAGPSTGVLMDAYEYSYESITITEIAFGTGAPTWAEYSPPSQYHPYQVVYIFLYIDGPLYYYSCYTQYRRDIFFSSSNSPTGNWILAPELPGGEYSPGVYKWVRPYLDSNYTTYQTEVNGQDVTHTLITATNINIELSGCITLKSVLEYYAGFFRLNYESSFFNDDPCPMGGTTLNLTMIQQISNLRETREAATKGMMKLKDLLSWIRDTFNVYWYIDSLGDWRLEHRRYFDSGLTYGYSFNLALNMSTFADYVKRLNRYEWSTPQLFRFEKLEFPYSVFPDWVEAGIEYPQNAITGNESTTKTPGWGTDLISMYEAREELATAGWSLIHADFVGGGGIFILKVVNTIGYISGVSIQNGRFSPANLLRDLWTWGRLLPTGKVNGAQTTFDSIERLKKQVELSFPLCCADVDLNGNVRTDLGDAIMDTATYESNTGMIKINLLYE